MTDTQSSTHTPGKWTLEGKIVGATIDKDNGRREVRAILEMIEGHQTEANARLVTAAPELLDALREIIQYTAPLIQAKDVLGFDIDRIARAAIEKATQ